ncbi:MAG: ParA family protein [Christensenellaceae bacterium]|nr:ParA family protein [Christensenellaceae bacterium]
MARTIVIANQKGGVGKTTTAVNLSTCLADLGQRVLLVDVDPQGNATSGLGIEKRALSASVYSVLIGGAAAKDVILHTQVERLDILPSNIELAGAEVEMVSLMARETILARALAQVADDYDFILLDSPPSLGLLTLNALAAADQVLVPIQCEFYALEGLSQLMNTVKLVKKHINARLEVEGVVLTMFDARTNLSIQVVEEVKRFFAGKVHRVIIPRNVRLGEAPSHGLPITRYDARCIGAEAYTELAREVMGLEED